MRLKFGRLPPHWLPGQDAQLFEGGEDFTGTQVFDAWRGVSGAARNRGTLPGQ